MQANEIKNLQLIREKLAKPSDLANSSPQPMERKNDEFYCNLKIHKYNSYMNHRCIYKNF